MSARAFGSLERVRRDLTGGAPDARLHLRALEDSAADLCDATGNALTAAHLARSLSNALADAPVVLDEDEQPDPSLRDDGRCALAEHCTSLATRAKGAFWEVVQIELAVSEAIETAYIGGHLPLSRDLVERREAACLDWPHLRERLDELRARFEVAAASDLDEPELRPFYAELCALGALCKVGCISRGKEGI